MILAGIDYSITSPAICLYDTHKKNFCFEHCQWYYVHSKPIIQMKNILGYFYPTWNTPIERFLKLAELLSVKANHYAMENYSYSSRGLTFSIGENGGILKARLYQKYSAEVILYSPASIKKLATQKGNANKEQMWDAFYQETEALKDFEKLKGKSPLSDIVDSYFVLKLLVQNML